MHELAHRGDLRGRVGAAGGAHRDRRRANVRMGCCSSKGDPDAQPEEVPVAVVRTGDGEFGPSITAEWLDAALHRSGVLAPDARVLQVNRDAMVVKSLEGHDREDGGGISGPKIDKLELTYSEGAPANLPTKMILKWGSLTHFVQDELSIRVYLWIVELNLGQMLRCEASVYRQQAALAKQGIKVPQAYYVGDVYPRTATGEPDDPGSCCFVCCGRRAAVRTVQLMEDASVDYEPGPIGWGDEAHGMTQARVRAMMANLVKLHAWGWGEGVRKIPIEGLWETSPHIGRTVGRMPRQVKDKSQFGNGKIVQKYKAAWTDYATLDLHGNSHKTFAEHPEYLTLLDAMVSGASLWEPKAGRLWPQEGTKPVGATVLHGDAHQWNHLFRKASIASMPADPNDLMLIDWQFTGGGHCAWEVHYMLMLSHEFQSVECDLGLLQFYHTQLIAHIAKLNGENKQEGDDADVGYTFEQFYEDYCVTILDTIAQDVITFTKFLGIEDIDKMMGDEKRRELMLLGLVCRDRNFQRAMAHIMRRPTMRAALIGSDAEQDLEGSISESLPLVAQA